MFYKNSRGQVAETTTWIVATLIIIFVLLISLYASSKLSVFIKTINTKDSASFSKEQTNILLKESLFAYLLTKNSEGINFYNQIKTDKKINSFPENFGESVFEKIYPASEVSIELATYENRYGTQSYSLNFETAEKIKIDENSILNIVINKK